MLIGLAAIFLLPRAFGYQPYMVVSASMQQSFPVGSLIFVREAAPEEIEVGDPITFSSGTLTITHRVMSVDNQKRVFITKGDSNNVGEVTPFENLKGKALDFSIPYLGYFSAWFITPQGRIVTAIVILCIDALSVVLRKLSELDELDDEDEDGKEGEEGKKCEKNAGDKRETGGEEADSAEPIAKEGEMIE